MAYKRPVTHGQISDIITKSCLEGTTEYLENIVRSGKIMHQHIVDVSKWVLDYHKTYNTMPIKLTFENSDYVDFWTDTPSSEPLKQIYNRYYVQRYSQTAQSVISEISTDFNGNNIEVLNKLGEFVRNSKPPEKQPTIDALSSDWDELFDTSTNKGLLTGLPLFDESVYGLNKGEQLTIFGDTNVGKSWFSSYIAAYNLLNKKNVAFVTGEMSKESVIARINAFNVGIPPVLLRNKFDATLMAKIKPIFQSGLSHFNKLGSKLLILNGINSADVIHKEICEFEENHSMEFDLIIVDGQYLMKTNNGKVGRDWNIQAELASDFYTMAFANNRRLITTNQLTRGNGGSLDISTSDMSGSLDYSRLSTFMMALVKPDQPEYIPGAPVLPIIHAKMVKMREGEVGTIGTIYQDHSKIEWFTDVNGVRVDLLKGIRAKDTPGFKSYK